MKRMVNCFAVLAVLAGLLLSCSACALTFDIPVPNGSFESPVVSGNQLLDQQSSGWTPYGTSNKVYLSHAPSIGVRDGDQILYIESYSSGVYKQLAMPTIQAGWTYTLSAWICGYNDNYRWASMSLHAVNPSNPNDYVVLAQRDDFGVYDWHLESLTSNPVPAAQAGWELEVIINGGYGYTGFDDVRITAIPPEWAVDVPVKNGSYESPVVEEGTEPQITPDGWTAYDQGYIYTCNYPTFPDGAQVAEMLMAHPSGIYQILDAPARVGSTYTMSSWIWGQSDDPGDHYATMGLHADNPVPPYDYVVLCQRGDLGAYGWHYESLVSDPVATSQDGWSLVALLHGGYGLTRVDKTTLLETPAATDIEVAVGSLPASLIESFESPAVTGEEAGPPDGWEPIGSNVSMLHDTAIARNGNQVVKIVGSSSGIYRRLSTTAEAGKEYMLSAWIWGQSDTNKYTCMGLHAVNPLDSNDWVVLCQRGDLGASGWHLETLTSSPVAEAQDGWYLEVQFSGGYGDTLVDKVTMMATDYTSLWQDNQVGVTDEVLPGWSPITYAGSTHTLSCWNRDVSFGNTSPFPAQITSQGENILYSPIHLDATVNGNQVNWTGTAISVDAGSSTDARYNFVTSTTSTNVNVENTSYLDYDGMLYFKMKLTPNQSSITVNSLKLVIPMNADNAQFWNSIFGGGEGPDNSERNPCEWFDYARGGHTPDVGIEWKRPFRPHMWVGDYDRGLTWIADDPYNWMIPTNGEPFELVHTGNPNVMEWKINFIGGNKTVYQASPLTIEFGLHPTPVRPLPEGWRLMGGNPELGQSPSILYWTTPATTSYWGYPEAADPAYVKCLTDDWHSRGMRVLPYMHPVRLDDYSPAWKAYGDSSWDAGYVDTLSPDVLAFPGGTAHGICPSVPDFREWMAWKNQQYLDIAGYDGLYFDHGWMTGYPCFKANHNHRADTGNGVEQLMGYREQCRRLYTMCKQRDPNNLVELHISSGLCTIFSSWADVTLNGEDLSTLMNWAREQPGTLNTTDIADIVSLDFWLAFYMGRQFGSAPTFLSYMMDPRHTNTYMLLTDSVGGSNPDPSLVQLYNDLDMGNPDMEFLPFWSNGILAEFPDGAGDGPYPDPLVSAYRLPGNFVMFAIGNLTTEPRRVTVSFDENDLVGSGNLQYYRLTDAFARYPLSTISVASFDEWVDARSYRLILLQHE